MYVIPWRIQVHLAERWWIFIDWSAGSRNKSTLPVLEIFVFTRNYWFPNSEVQSDVKWLFRSAEFYQCHSLLDEWSACVIWIHCWAGSAMLTVGVRGNCWKVLPSTKISNWTLVCEKRGKFPLIKWVDPRWEFGLWSCDNEIRQQVEIAEDLKLALENGVRWVHPELLS